MERERWERLFLFLFIQIKYAICVPVAPGTQNIPLRIPQNVNRNSTPERIRRQHFQWALLLLMVMYERAHILPIESTSQLVKKHIIDLYVWKKYYAVFQGKEQLQRTNLLTHLKNKRINLTLFRYMFYWSSKWTQWYGSNDCGDPSAGFRALYHFVPCIRYSPSNRRHIREYSTLGGEGEGRKEESIRPQDRGSKTSSYW